MFRIDSVVACTNGTAILSRIECNGVYVSREHPQRCDWDSFRKHAASHDVVGRWVGELHERGQRRGQDWDGHGAAKER